MCLTEGSRHRRAEQAHSRDGESWPQDLPGAEHPRPLSSPRRQEKGGSRGSPCSLLPATQLGDFACTILLSLRLALPLSLPHHCFIFLGEARCCSQAASLPVRAIHSGCLLHLFWGSSNQQSHFTGQCRNTFFPQRSNTASWFLLNI